ncbi:hypothetical protein TrLO_g9261 [Triparma laevis f. longispina]|uniref:WW domain-containing protein n=1 Tax=Triparma laevis f. longispina TaxID=1714387 RepID=A0A9W7FQR8_9STRA|nr:hypothetical protein TrLO_g9261 [Triparma laevis f. longispina]
MAAANIIPDDIIQMLQGVTMKTSARNMTQLNRLLSDGTVIAKIVHTRYPKMVVLDHYTESTSTDRKMGNWLKLQSKVLGKLKCTLEEDDIKTLAAMGPGVNEKLITFLREFKQQMDNFEAIYKEKHSTLKTTDQKMKEEEERRGNDTSSQYSNSTVGRTMQRMSSGISPPQRMRGASTEDASRRPSKIAASIALELEGNLSGEIILGSAGRRGQEKRRSMAREKSAKALRNGKATKELSSQEMDDMFEKISDKLTKDLDRHTDKLDRLDVKSKQFDKHMEELRLANKQEMINTEKSITVLLRTSSENPDLNENAPGFGMGTPKFVQAPENEDGVFNNSFVGSVDPYSNQLMELNGGVAAPPPPPGGAPPAHILEEAKRKKMAEEGVDENGNLLDEDGNPYIFDEDLLSDEEGEGGLTLDVTAEMDEDAKKELADINAGKGGNEETPEGPSIGGAVQGNLAPSANGVDWLETMHPQHQRHYYMHHSGVSQWEKPSKGCVQCTDVNSGKIYYVQMETGVSMWSPPTPGK